MNSADVLEKIEELGQLPILPQTLLQIQKVATDDRSSAEDLAEVILRDQALTMRVLRIVNSAMYRRGSEETVTTIHKAVVTIGFETVRKLALGLSVFDMMSKLSRSPHLLEVAEHSMVTAAFAQKLAERSGMVPPEEAFVTALIHDVGKAVLVECSPSDYDAVLADIAAGRDTIEAERAHFGMSHDRAGRRLAARWKLPRPIQLAIGDHHDFEPLHPPKRMDPALAVIVYANAMSRFTGDPESQVEERKILEKAGRVLNIATARLEDLYVEIGEEIEILAQAVNVSIGNLRDYGAVVNVPGSASVAPPLSAEEIAERTAKQLRLYRSVGTGLAHGDDPEELLDRIVDSLVDILGFERAILFRVDEASAMLRPWKWVGPETESLIASLDLPVTESTGALALCVTKRRAYHVPMADNEAYDGLAGTQLLELTRSTGFVCAPVVCRGQVRAVIFADHGPEGPDVVQELATEVNGLAMQAGLVLQAVDASAPVGDRG